LIKISPLEIIYYNFEPTNAHAFIKITIILKHIILLSKSIETDYKKKLMVFERKVLRIFGPTKETNGTWRIKTNGTWRIKTNGTWRIKTSDELDELIRHKNIIKHIKSQRLSWFGHLHRMPEERMVKTKYASGNRC
jgi:hypothetical protein